MDQTLRPKSGHRYGVVLSLVLCVVVFLSLAGPATAQEKDKKRKKDAQTSDGTPTIPLNDEQQVDYLISSMLAVWQIGDVDKLHQFYADDVTVVNGVWGPPLIGWASFASVYQQQRARAQQVRMDRTNTMIRISGTTAWACYQWDFSGVVDGQPSRAFGQTTLVLEKRNNRWIIVHNHTGLAQPAPSGVPTTPGNAAPPTQPPATPGTR
jgi:ketosteroid isomerase-like protein